MAQMDIGQEPPSPTSLKNSLDNPFFSTRLKRVLQGKDPSLGCPHTGKKRRIMDI
jgi:hypothetical protein